MTFAPISSRIVRTFLSPCGSDISRFSRVNSCPDIAASTMKKVAEEKSPGIVHSKGEYCCCPGIKNSFMLLCVYFIPNLFNHHKVISTYGTSFNLVTSICVSFSSSGALIRIDDKYCEVTASSFVNPPAALPLTITGAESFPLVVNASPPKLLIA